VAAADARDLRKSSLTLPTPFVIWLFSLLMVILSWLVLWWLVLLCPKISKELARLAILRASRAEDPS
jgi:hypothetical protein